MNVWKFVIYTRYSSDLQSDKSNEDQEREVRRLLEKKGFDHRNALVIYDRAESGTTNNRPGFQRLVQLAATEKNLIIAIDDQARLSRGDDVLEVFKDFVALIGLCFAGRYLAN